MEIRFYTTPAGNSPVEKYLEGLEPKERVLLLEAFEDLRQQGIGGSRVVTRQIESKLWEIKVSRHRVFYVTVAGPTLVLLHAYKKQSAKAPRAEINVARTRLKEVQNG